MRSDDFKRGLRDGQEGAPRNTPTGGTRAAGRQAAYDTGYNQGRAALRIAKGRRK